MNKPTGRGRPWLRDYPLLLWLSVAVVIALIHRQIPDANWLLLHLVLLGALTHSILVWSFHFAQTLLRSPANARQASAQNLRLGLLALGTAVVLVGVPTGWWWVTLTGGLLVIATVAWHGIVLWRMMRRALLSRFRMAVRYYVASAAFLVVGAGFGITVAWSWPDPWYGRLMITHALTNLLGWIGLTLVGTLITLWPTILRTQIDPGAERRTRQALPLFIAAILLVITGALSGVTWVAALGILGYLAALAHWGMGLLGPIRTAPPREFAPASVAISLVWLVIGLVWAGWVLVSAPNWTAAREDFIWPATVLAAGFGLQLVTGALSYLLPSSLGGGPSVVRAGQKWFNKAGSFRLITINGALLLWLLPTPSWVKVMASGLALVVAAAFLPLLIAGIRASILAKQALIAQEGPPTIPAGRRPEIERPNIFTGGQLIAALTALATITVIGVGLDPGAIGMSGSAPAPSPGTVAPTGNTVRISVSAKGMRYFPSEVSVKAGDRLVVDLTNDDTTTHDLVIGAARTPRIGPGKSVELDAGVITESTQGYCSVAGHRQMGMVFDVIVEGQTSPGGGATAMPTPPGHDMGNMGNMGGMHPGEEVAPQDVVDPVLPPLSAEREQHLTLRVTEVPLEVAPGVWQKRWTYNGRPVGPTLHGRVGDVFVITLINDGTMGHSIDFHAGALAPDRPMRTIEPGESLTYRFTATKAGIWMYHCSTHPMTAHIAAGMTGAVVIEPDGLPEVDRSYILVQTEVFLANHATDAASAVELDDARAQADGQPDYVVFNGVANQYDHQRLTAKVGERVRFWVLDSGPNRATSFHIVGAQFDTVFREGGYLLQRGKDPFGNVDGGSQALGLQPAEAGFVETVFPEAGNYPFVSHVMVDAERGAHGYVQVSE